MHCFVNTVLDQMFAELSSNPKCKRQIDTWQYSYKFSRAVFEN